MGIMGKCFAPDAVHKFQGLIYLSLWSLCLITLTFQIQMTILMLKSDRALSPTDLVTTCSHTL